MNTDTPQSEPATDSVIFTGGRVYRILPHRLRVEFGDEFWEMDFAALADRLRYDRQSPDRKQFAAMAMQGVISSLDRIVSSNEVAKVSVMMADALLRELAK